MRILDTFGNELQSYDPEAGYLQPEELLVCHHDAVEAVEEKGHYETVAEYPNGGKDVEWVVDTPGIEAKQAYDEYETIFRYLPYTKQELISIQIERLKRQLAQTDYTVIKIAEGAATAEEYKEVIAQRAQWRKEINWLQKEGENNGN